MASRKAEFKAGIVVVVGLAILALGLYLVSGGAEQFQDKKRITILFRNGGGIGTGDAVYVAGRRVGKVVRVSAGEEVVNGTKGTYVVVDLEILKDARVHTDSRVSVSKTVTGIVTLSIEFGEEGQLAPEGAKLLGQKLATFEEAIHQGSQLLGDARRMIGTVDKAIVKLESTIAEFDMAGLRKDLVAILKDLNESSKALRGILTDAAPEVDTLLKSASAGAKNFDDMTGKLVTDWDEIAITLKATLEGARRASEDLKAILAENRPALKAAVQSIADGALRIAPVLEQIENLAQAAENMVIDAGPKLSSGLRAASLAFKNFEAVTEDLKTAPWKLINEPSAKESDEVHLYNAARQFVDSAERIQEVLDELDALRRKGGLADERMKAELDALTDRLQQSLKNYGLREKTLVGLLGAGKAGK